MLENGGQAGLGDEVQVFGEFIVFIHQPVGAHFDLAFGFFARNVQHALGLGHIKRHLQHER